ncbi:MULTISPECIES: RadC family protein [Sphingomonas]|jgi:DNA repair protein RadC|uniref:RadC family protein n=1 Tax=Sphingomonas TaxID=13687 RepID=UPI00082C6B24|nr:MULTISPECIES: DNA repair protein RadC [Sphingomonas]MBY0302506.1 DNA repair protein RadC [Sphingomonas ginsenosidimutans]
MLDADAPVTDASGHRARLRARLFADAEGLHDHELIEYLLAVALPRQDTKDLAKRLLHEFGGIGGLLAADAQSLMRVKGMGDVTAAAIKIAHATSIRLVRARTREAPLLSNWQALRDYLHAALAHDTIEQFRVLHLNTRNMLIRDEQMSRGTIDEAAVHVREVIKRALEIGSAALILVHNHPSGDPSPSRADIDITRAIVAAGKPLNIVVHDHIIVGAAGQVSLRAKGLI